MISLTTAGNDGKKKTCGEKVKEEEVMRKNVMKKVTAAILAASMVFSLAACS